MNVNVYPEPLNAINYAPSGGGSVESSLSIGIGIGI